MECCNMLLSELKAKEVVSIKDCRKLGHISNLEFDCRTGCIKKIMIPKRWCCIPCCFFNDTEYVINYSEICQIGPDVILVNV